MRISTGLVIILTMILLLNILAKPESQPIVVVDTGGVPCPIFSYDKFKDVKMNYGDCIIVVKTKED